MNLKGSDCIIQPGCSTGSGWIFPTAQLLLSEGKQILNIVSERQLSHHYQRLGWYCPPCLSGFIVSILALIKPMLCSHPKEDMPYILENWFQSFPLSAWHGLLRGRNVLSGCLHSTSGFVWDLETVQTGVAAFCVGASCRLVCSLQWNGGTELGPIMAVQYCLVTITIGDGATMRLKNPCTHVWGALSCMYVQC